MGKGDQRSRRGKIWRGTFGKRRPKKSDRAAKVVTAPSAPETKPPKRSSKAVKAVVPEAIVSEAVVSEAIAPEATDSGPDSDSPTV
jgi:30S ribosomal protein S31